MKSKEKKTNGNQYKYFFCSSSSSSKNPFWNVSLPAKLQTLASLWDVNLTALSCSPFPSSQPACLPHPIIPSHCVFPGWTVGPALENYWWVQSHERLLLASLMCCSLHTTPDSSSGLSAVSRGLTSQQDDRGGWGFLVIFNLWGYFGIFARSTLFVSCTYRNCLRENAFICMLGCLV